MAASELTARAAASAASTDYDRAPAKLKAWRETRDRADAERSRLTLANARVVTLAAELASLEKERAAGLDAEERVRDLAKLAGLEQLLGRAAYLREIAPEVAGIIKARQEIEAHLERMRAQSTAQCAAHLGASTLAAKHGAAAPTEPVGSNLGERIALVSVALALAAAYPEGGAALAPWLALNWAPGRREEPDALPRWVAGLLGGMGRSSRSDHGHYGPDRIHVTAEQTIAALLATGNDGMRDVERELVKGGDLARMAARTERHRDPIFKAHTAVQEAACSLELGGWASVGRAEVVRRYINEGRAALAPVLASKMPYENYTAAGEQGVVRLSAGGECSRVDNVLEIGASHRTAVRAWLGDTRPYRHSDAYPAAPTPAPRREERQVGADLA